MPVIQSEIDIHGETFAANREARERFPFLGAASARARLRRA